MIVATLSAYPINGEKGAIAKVMTAMSIATNMREYKDIRDKYISVKFKPQQSKCVTVTKDFAKHALVLIAHSDAVFLLEPTKKYAHSAIKIRAVDGGYGNKFDIVVVACVDSPPDDAKSSHDNDHKGHKVPMLVPYWHVPTTPHPKVVNCFHTTITIDVGPTTIRLPVLKNNVNIKNGDCLYTAE